MQGRPARCNPTHFGLELKTDADPEAQHEPGSDTDSTMPYCELFLPFAKIHAHGVNRNEVMHEQHQRTGVPNSAHGHIVKPWCNRSLSVLHDGRRAHDHP